MIPGRTNSKELLLLNHRKTESISHGPVFGGDFSNLGLLGVGISLLAAAISTGFNYYVSIFFFALMVLFFIAFMNFKGVEIDYDRRRIRTYHNYLGIRWGLWQSLDKFDNVVFYMLSTRSNVSSANTGVDSDFHSKSYTIELIGKTKHNKIELNEIVDYNEAIEFAKEIARKLDKKFIDVIDVALRHKYGKKD